MKPVFVVQALDDGTFLGEKDGEKQYYVSLKNAYRFAQFDDAVENARDIDPDLHRVTVHCFFEN